MLWRLLSHSGWILLLVMPLSWVAIALAESKAVSTFEWHKPAWLPAPPVPDNNPMTAPKVSLGRHLFYDHRLSVNGTMACASCHEQALGFSDGKVRSEALHNALAPRNAMTLGNVGYSPVLTWANPFLRSLEIQALIPLFGEEPHELGNSGQEAALFQRLSSDAEYRKMFRLAFPELEGVVSLRTVTAALAAFQRSLITADSPYDRYRYGGDPSAISESAKRGEHLFFSEKFECYHCHQGFNFTDTVQTERSRFTETAFHNTGLYNTDGQGTYPVNSRGLFELTDNPNHMGQFRTQSLRNIEVSAPYFHDGSAETLSDVIAHYAAGGRTLTGEHAGDGSTNPYKDSLIRGFTVTDAEERDLIAFLHSLTDVQFLTNPDFANPWPVGHIANGTTSQERKDDVQ